MQVAIEIVCFSHFLVMFNPVCIGVENALDSIRGKTNPYWIKMISRAILMIICFGIAVTVPGFGSLVDLVGATLVMLLQIIFPIVFYVVLSRKYLSDSTESKGRGARYIEYGFMGFCLCLALIGMVFGTWSAVKSW
mmetsp:Transcript_18354/g.15666  ORF Transcript_18354/g.15666 Transcript_18354/m.15666 type:complete len:136 (-) Transcript_18354:32-439(-)